MTLKDSAPPTAAALAYGKLRGDILRGVLVPLERLRVNDTSERYGCGASPVREALNRLAAEHLVVHSEQRGFAVAPISAAGLRDLTKARSMLMEIAMREAVLNDRRIAAGARWAITGDAGVRALVAWSMGWRPAQQAAGTDWLVPYLLDLMDDPYEAVRMVAARSLTRIPGFERGGFDPLARPDRRAESLSALRARVLPVPLPPEVAERTLYDTQGGRSDEVARLHTQRDDRPLILEE